MKGATFQERLAARLRIARQERARATQEWEYWGQYVEALERFIAVEREMPTTCRNVMDEPGPTRQDSG